MLQVQPQNFDSILSVFLPLKNKDCLRLHFGLDQTRVGFDEYGEPATLKPPHTKNFKPKTRSTGRFENNVSGSGN